MRFNRSPCSEFWKEGREQRYKKIIAVTINLSNKIGRCKWKVYLNPKDIVICIKKTAIKIKIFPMPVSCQLVIYAAWLLSGEGTWEIRGWWWAFIQALENKAESGEWEAVGYFKYMCSIYTVTKLGDC